MSTAAFTAKPVPMWAVSVTVFLVALNLRPAITAIAPVATLIRADAHTDSATIGMLSAAPILVFGLLSAFVSRLGTRLGYQSVVAYALLVLAAGFGIRLLPGLIPMLWGMVVIGAGITGLNVLLPAYIKGHPPHRRGPLMGLYTVCLYLGPALTAAVTLPISRWLGSWQLGLFVWVIPVAIAAPAWLLLRRREGDTETAVAQRRTISLAAVSYQPLTWSIVTFFAIMSVLFFTIAGWLPNILVQAGHGSGSASFLLALAELTAIPCALGVSIAIHRTRNQVWATVLGPALLLAGTAAIALRPDGWTPVWMIVFGAGLGIAGGASFSLPLLRTRSAAEAALVAGLTQTVGYSLSAVGPVGAGALHDLTGSWGPVLAVLAVCIVIQGVAGAYAGRGVFIESPREEGAQVRVQQF
ncbi:MFS transporter [Nocardia sp. CDC153]|uniref:MFS transporter n=1 Tax=Nocardia sp. CDC153 TaxID=3112167 RepID=UPI002DBB1720|nr:MFS transporter [Nocardia sp. CDC153]MEC3956379.1 MFS transporter [Nocardia sp. CDC153]